MALETSAIAEKYVELSHGRTRYLEAGTGAPAILIHGVGYTQGGHSWRLNIGPLAQKLRVLAVDCVGWGLGDRLDLEYSFAYLVDFVREFQDGLGLKKSHIVGHSMGGWIASVFAYESPDRVDKLVLVGSGGAAPRTLRSMTEFEPPTGEQIREGLRTRFKLPESEVEAWAREEDRIAQVPGALEAYRKILNHMNNGLTRQRYNTIRRFPYITAPTLVVWGENDQVNALEMGQKTHELIQGSKLVVLKDTDHFVPTESPEEFNKALLEFL